MPATLNKTIKREVVADGETLVLTLTPEGVTLTPKGKRKGKTFAWGDLWSGQSVLAEQLRASVEAFRKP